MSGPILRKSFAFNELPEVVREFWKATNNHHVFLFYGEMGAGKTTFISALCQYLGIADHVSSPTFALINEYSTTTSPLITGSIFHMDLYRLNSEAEAIHAGIEDCILNALSGGDRIFIEWPEKCPGLMPAHALRVELALEENNLRSLIVSGT